MIKRLTFDGVAFTDAKGIYRVIYGCPLKQRRELAHALSELGQVLAQSHSKSVAEAYDHDREFAAIADHALSLSGIDPQWLTIEMLVEFVLPHRDSEGKPQRPILEQLNFPEVDAVGEGGTVPQAIAAIWTHTRNLSEALKAAGYQPDELPGWEELSEILAEHAAMTDPKAAEKREQEAIARKIEEQADAGELQGWFSAGPSIIAPPQQSAQILEEILRGDGAS